MKRRPLNPAAMLAGLLVLAGCDTASPDRDPLGEPFPEVLGRDLDDREISLPGDRAGAPWIAMIGYVQAAQFDIDRWMLGLLQVEAEVPVVEIPAVGGWFPATFLQETIDDGMRAGIPRESWDGVITLYGDDARRVRDLTGTGHPRNARVLLLDREGTIRWFWDEGYSPARLLELVETARDLGTE